MHKAQHSMAGETERQGAGLSLALFCSMNLAGTCEVLPARRGSELREGGGDVVGG